MIEIEKEFGTTSKLLLGQKLENIDDYGEWLSKNVPQPYVAKSSLSGIDVWLPPPLVYLRKTFNKSKVISMEEMEKRNTSPFSPQEIENATLKEVSTKFIKPVAYFCGNFRFQNYENFDKVSGGGGGRNVYHSEDTYLDVKNIAFSNYALYCENVFGSHNITYSQFCIHAYNSTALARCFEVESCSNSQDLLFCHNCENVRDSIFCFNAKNLKYAIGNIPLPIEKYKELKGKLLGEILKELKEKKQLGFDIYNLNNF
ncbi:hypothetical protein HY988_05755 [Candidatus Micrarchaeota archaeon]|nr:hypothetical protein [Candidatus Micrarchaeota archaeon]